MIARLLARFRRPAHIRWGGDYTTDLTWLPLWEPNVNGEIR